jgi:hypothetical protein
MLHAAPAAIGLAAGVVVARVLDAVAMLAQQSSMGRPGRARARCHARRERRDERKTRGIVGAYRMTGISLIVTIEVVLQIAAEIENGKPIASPRFGARGAASCEFE